MRGGYSENPDGYSGSSSLMRELEAARRAQEEAAAERKAAYESALRSTYKTSLGELKQNAASANTGEYVRYMQGQRQLPQQAALLGTGGLSESSLMGLNAAYGGNLNKIELERARGQAELQNQLNQGIAAGEGAYAETMAGIGGDYASKLLNLSMQEQANQAARNQALQAQSNWEREFAANQAQLGTTNAFNAQKYADSQAKSAGTYSGVKAATGITEANDKDLDYWEDNNAPSGISERAFQNSLDKAESGVLTRSQLVANRQEYVKAYGQAGYDYLYSISK